MHPLPDSVSLSMALPGQESPRQTSVVSLLAIEPPTTTEVKELDLGYAFEEALTNCDPPAVDNTPSREPSFVSRAITEVGSSIRGASFRTTTMTLPGTMVIEPSFHSSSFKKDRCHFATDREYSRCSPERTGIFMRPVARSSQYDWFSALRNKRRM